MRGVEDIEDVAANVGGLHRAESRARPEPGGDARRLRRPDRARPARREGAGRRLPRRVGRCRCRSSRRISISSTSTASRCCGGRRARCSGPARCRERSDTSRISPSSGVTKGFAELGGNADGGGSAATSSSASTCRSATRPRCASPRTTTALPDTWTRSSRISAWTRTSTTGSGRGVRAAVTIRPNERLSITPRLVYQRVESNGWNRIDDYNILANPFTTTRPAVTLDERRQFTQLEEEFTDDFVLADVSINYQLRRSRPHLDHVVHVSATCW